jgi:hypothetical protein
MVKISPLLQKTGENMKNINHGEHGKWRKIPAFFLSSLCVHEPKVCCGFFS